MQTLSSELASSPQVKHATFGVLVACLISWVNPLHFSVQMWPWCFSSQLHILSSSMAFLPAKRSGMQLFASSDSGFILPNYTTFSGNNINVVAAGKRRQRPRKYLM
jgi:hypothetical protein